MSSKGAFFIGTNAISKPFAEPFAQMPDPWPPVHPVIMKPCVCMGFNSLDDESEIPEDSLRASGLTEEDVREVMESISEVLTRRTRCCWYWCLCCPCVPCIWWLDMCTQQCKCGLTKSLCQDPALKEIDSVLEEANDRFGRKGVEFARVGDTLAVTTVTHRTSFELLDVGHTNTVYFDGWLIRVSYGK